MASDRGLIDKGKRADLVIVDHVNFGRVRHVMIGGKIVVWNGAIMSNVANGSAGTQVG
jgi:adenine deaminase